MNGTAAGSRPGAGSRIIDTHAHLWDIDEVGSEPWLEGPAHDPIRRDFRVSELRDAGDRHGVDGVVLVQSVCRDAETEKLLLLASQDSFVRGVVGWADLTRPDLPEHLTTLGKSAGGPKLRGLRHLTLNEPDAHWLDRADVRRGLETVAAHGLTFDLLVTGRELPAAVRLAREVPRLRLILDHCGNPPIGRDPGPEWRSAQAQLGDLENVACKISGLTSRLGRPWTSADIQPVVDAVLGGFGSRRLMFGSDWPVSLLAGDYGSQITAVRQALRGRLGHEEIDLVLHGNALTWYAL